MRFGDDILPGGKQHERYQAFIKWAAGYETTMDVSRNALRHQQWLEKLPCPVIHIINESTVDEAVSDIVSQWALTPSS
ncbi:hypothetical protein [Symbiopectobacterium purcellii]|uniref:Uncharacterized protein n=1 Tax=Symbiopectobacterium purcellii TaxID=2871826 RepID=A0ABX9AIL7_9ENTR|nr:hypothetical protein [Symbiopectobacterium purcellii]QZN94958.1 hypothetical protein K6K13_17220 [Symbiopectobacterium purcellii]